MHTDKLLMCAGKLVESRISLGAFCALTDEDAFRKAALDTEGLRLRYRSSAVAADVWACRNLRADVTCLSDTYVTLTVESSSTCIDTALDRWRNL
jgi:hypothetical protein